MSEKSKTNTPFVETAYPDWASQNKFENPVESLGRYVDHVRGEYSAAGLYTDSVEDQLSYNLSNALSSRGLLTEENQGLVNEQLRSLSKPDLMSSVNVLLEEDNPETPFLSDEEKEKLTVYQSIFSSGFNTEAQLARNPEEYQEVTEIVRSTNRKKFEEQFKRGEILAAVVEDESGNEIFIGGEIPEGMTEADVIKSSSKYGVSTRHLFALRHKREKDPFSDGLMRYEVQKRKLAELEIRNKIKEETKLEAALYGLAKNYGEEKTWDWGDHTNSFLTEVLSSGSKNFRVGWNTMVGDKDGARQAGRELAMDEAREAFLAEADTRRLEVVQRLSKATGYSGDIVDDVLHDLTVKYAFEGDSKANVKPFLKYSDNKDELGQNVHETKYSGVLVDPSLMVSPDEFSRALDQANVTGDKRERAHVQREVALEENFHRISRIISQEDAYADAWIQARIEGQQNGLSKRAILEKFRAEVDFSALMHRAEGVFSSIYEGVTGIVYGVGAVMDKDWGRAGLQAIAANNAQAKEFAQVMGLEMGAGQEMMEAAGPLVSDAIVTAGLVALTKPTMGASLAGLAAYTGAKATATTSARLVVAAAARGALKTVGKETAEAAAERILKSGVLKGATKDRTLKVIKAYNGNLASKLGVASAAFIPAATRSGGSTYGAVFSTLEAGLTEKHTADDGSWEEGWNAERVKEEAHTGALGSALTAGTITGLLTSSFSAIGRGGLEDTFLRGMSFRQVKQITSNVLGRNLGDQTFIEVMKQSLKKVVTKHALVEAPKSFLKSALDEGFEEGIDEFINSLIVDAYTNQDTPFLERMEQVWHGFLLGAALGGGGNLVSKAAKNIAPNMFLDRNAAAMVEQEAFKQFERDVEAEGLGDKLRESGSPATAQEAERLVRQYKGAERSEPQSMLASTSVDEDEALGEAAITIEDQTEEASLEDLEKANYELQTKLTSEAVRAELANYEAKELLRGNNPDVEGTAVAEALEDSEGDAVSGSVAITQPHTATQKPVDYDADYESTLEVIKSKHRVFKKMEKQQQRLENTGASESAQRMRKEIQLALQSNRVLDKQRVDTLTKLAAEARDNNKKAQAASDAKGPSEEDAKGIDTLVNSGFPHSLTVDQLERLGVKLQKIDRASLTTLSKELSTRIKNKFPVAADPFTKRGQALPQIYGSGKVYLDESGNGIFNNDPVAMLTFLESGIPIPVPSTAIDSGTLNPSFEISPNGNPRYVTDIMVQESGGKVSAKTAFDKVGALEEDYSVVADLAKRLTELKKSVTLSDQFKVVNPFNTRSKSIKITTVEERAKDLGTFTSITDNIFETDTSLKSLQTQFKNTANLAASLEMQVALYEYQRDSATESGNELPPVPFNASAILRGQAAYAMGQQVARKKRSTRSFLSVFTPDADVDSEAVVTSSNYVAASANPLSPLPERRVRDYIAGMNDLGAEAIRDNENLKSSIAGLLNSEYHGESNRAFTMPPEELFNELIQFFGKGNHISNQAGIAFQQRLRDDSFDQQGTNVGVVLRMLSLNSPNVFPAIDEDVNFQSRIRTDLIELGAKEPSLEQALSFHKDIAKETEGNYKRAIVSSRQMAVIADLNQRELNFYGITDNSADGVIGALEILASKRTKRTHDDLQRTLFTASEVLLEQREFIKSIKFSFEATDADYAGHTYVDQEGTPTIVINTARDSRGGIIDTIIHELVHAFTDRVLNLDPSLRTPEQNGAVDRIEALMKLLRKRAAREGAPDSVLYGLTNINEFASVLMTSKDFQAFIRGVKVGAGQRNFLTRALAAISRFFAVRGGAEVKSFQAIMDVSTLVRSTGTTEPATGSGFANQVANKVVSRQRKRSRLASSIGMAEEVAANEALDKAAFEYFQFAVDFVPPEINIVMDNTTDVIAEFDSETESILFNGRRAAAKVNQLVAAVDGKPIRREHIIAAILNEEIAHVAAFARLSQAEVQELMDGLNDLDGQSIIEQYYPEGEREAALERFRSEDSSISEGEKFILAEEQLRIHVQKVLRGAETNEQVNFLLENPSTLGTVKQYFKNYLTKITYAKTLKDVSPQMRDSVNRVVSEVRAMEMRYRLSPNGMHFDSNNPEGTMNQILKQLEMHQSITPRDDEDSARLQSRFGSDTDLKLTDFDVDSFPVEFDLFKTKAGKLKGAPPQVKSDKDVDKLMDRLKQLTIEGSVGRFWYEDAADKILEITNGDLVEAEKFTALLAIYSPQTGVEVNTYFAVRAYEQHANGVSRADYQVKTKVQDDKARAVLYDTAPWKGRKTDNFYKNLMFHLVSKASPEDLASMQIDTEFLNDIQQPVTVDMWVYRAMGYDTIGLTDDKGQGAFGFSEKLINRLAYALNQNRAPEAAPYQAHQIQAMLWTAIKARSEDKDVKKKTEAQSIRAGDLKIIYPQGKKTRKFPSNEGERKHQLRWTKNALAAEGVDFLEASRSFDYFVNSMGLTATWEVIASEQTPIGKKLAAMTTEQKRSFTEQAMQLIVDPVTGEDTLARDLGIAISTAKMSMGGYAGGVTPNVLSTLYPNKPAGDYDDDAIRSYSRSLQYIFMQDAVPWSRLVKTTKEDLHYKVVNENGRTIRKFDSQGAAEDYAAKAKKDYTVVGGEQSSGINLAFDGELTENKLQEIQDYLSSVNSDLGLTQISDNEVIVVNYKMDYNNMLPVLTDEEFANKIIERYGKETEQTYFTTVGEYGYHDWATDNEGAAILETSPRFTPDVQERVRDRRERFLQISSDTEGTVTPRLQSRYGAGSVIPSELDAESIDFSNWIEMLDVPLMEYGTYKSPSSLFGKLIKGYADRDLIRFKEERDSFVREAKKLGEDFKQKHDRIIKEASKNGVEIPPELISRASGSNVGSQLTEDQVDGVEARFNQDRSKANAAADPKQRKVLLEIAAENKVANEKNLRIENRKALLEDRNQAIRDLLSISPEAHDLILDLRKLVDDLSAKGNELFSDFIQGKDEFSATFDMNGGLYITRRYRMFEDNDYLARIRDESDPTYAQKRQDAINYFAQQYMDYHVKKEVRDKGLTEQDARFNVELDLQQKGLSARTKGKDMMTEFLNAYEKNAIKPELDVYESADGGRSIMMNSKKFKGSALKALANNLNEKKNISAPIRSLLGEYGDEAGGDNIAHTLVHTSSIMANQAFFNRVVDYGTKAEVPWLVTSEAIAEDLELPVAQQKYAGWQQLKSDEGAMDWNPVKGYYTKPEIVKDFQDLIQMNQAEAVSKETSSPSIFLASKLVQYAHRATGLSLAAKTLGSVGFYVRNMLGNAMFFGPMQGYMGGFGKAFGEGVGVISALGGDAENSKSQIVRAALGSRAAMDAELTVLASMNVFGDEMEANLLRELLIGKMTVPSAENKLAKIAKSIENKTKIGKEAYEKGVLAATRLASAMDAYYKIGLYQFELDTLKEAALADADGGKFKRLLDENNEPSVDMKRAAALKVKQVSQSYSQAPPAIKGLTRHPAGLLIAPYVRFAAEVPRITGNTFKLLRQERAEGKNNPVMRRRYLKRLAGMMSTMGFTFAVPAFLKSLAGIGEDEDEALRKGMPSYLRDHTFYYYKSDDQLYSFDLTYLNPFSVIADPVARSFEKLFDQDEVNPVDASIELVAGLFRPYFNEQILSGAVTDVATNENQYGGKIMYGEDTAENLKRAFIYIWEKAYEPRSLAKLRKAFKAAEGDTPSSDMFTDPLGIIFGELLPIKPHKVDIQNNLRAYLSAHTGDYRELSSKMNRLLSESSMTDGDIFNLYDDIAETRRSYNNEFRRVIKGFNNLGVSWSDINAQAKSRGVSKERLRLNYNGWMNRPAVSRFIKDKLRETPTGRLRLRKLDNYSRKDNRYLKLD
jgi:hypothetical protein